MEGMLFLPLFYTIPHLYGIFYHFLHFCQAFFYYFLHLWYNQNMFKNKLKIAVFTLACLLLACSSNENSTLNHPPKKLAPKKSKAKIENLVIDRDYGEDEKDIVVFSTNDSLSAFNDNLGVAAVKYYFDHFDRNENYATLVDIGNFSVGTEEAENSKGKSAIEIMNEAGYDIVVPGSLEFSYGIETFYENMKMLKSNIVCCNIYDTKKKAFPFLPYVIYKYGELKIAYVGVTSPEALLIKDNYENFFDENNEQLIYFFEDETGDALYKQIQTAVDTAKAEGADKVILLAHLGMEGITERWSTIRVIANTKDIDAVIDGHSMEVLDNGLMVNKVGAFIPLVQAGSRFKYLGAMNITKEDYIYPAVMKERSVNKKDEKFQMRVDEILAKYK